MKQIYADFNDIAVDRTLPLTCLGSVDCIAGMGGLEDGEEVWFSDGEVRARGRVYLTKSGAWQGRSDWHFTR